MDRLVSRTDEGFSTSVYSKNFAVSLTPHTRSCHPPSQKMAAFYTFVNLTLKICSDPISFNSEIQYLKTIALERDYNPSIINKDLFKLQNPCLSHPFHSNSNINIIIPFFPNSGFSIAKILKQHNFKVIFSAINKLSLSKLKDPIGMLNCWKSIVILASVVYLLLDKQNVDYVSL